MVCVIFLFTILAGANNTRGALVETAKEFLGTKYLRGGTSTSGFDCSGFVMYVYGRYKINLPRTSESQYLAGKKVSIAAALPGDIVCFKINGKRVSHVGIYLGDSRFIHAPVPGKQVKIESINEKYWKKRFFAVVRIAKLDAKP